MSQCRNVAGKKRVSRAECVAMNQMAEEICNGREMKDANIYETSGQLIEPRLLLLYILLCCFVLYLAICPVMVYKFSPLRIYTFPLRMSFCAGLEGLV